MKIKIKLPGCNFDCNYCAKVNRVVGKIEIDKIKSFIKSAKENGINELQWSGGEPTIQKDFLKLVGYSKDLGMYQSVTTNGSFSEDHLLKLKNNGVNRLNISLDTMSPILFKELTGKDCFETVYNNIIKASQIFSEVVKINTVVSNVTLPGISELYNHFKNMDNIVPRFLQLTYKGDDGFVNKHRVSTIEIGNKLPMGDSGHHINVDYPEFSNPVACYFRNNNGIFSIIPQKHTCKDQKCNKIWYINGRVFICKMRVSRSFIVDKSINYNMAKIISEGKTSNSEGHKTKDYSK